MHVERVGLRCFIPAFRLNFMFQSAVVEYEGWSTHSHNHAISLQNHGAGHDTIPYIKAMDIPFHLIYGSLICVKRLQRDRQNKKGNLQTPGRHQNMITKYLSVGLWSWFSYQQVALNVLFQMRYESIPYSKKQPSDRQRGWDTSCFHPIQALFCLLFCTVRSSWGLHTSLLI